MSQYIHFFIRHDNQFIRFNTYGRGSTIYEYFSDAAPYEHVQRLEENFLQEIENRVEADLLINRESLTRYKKRIQSIEKYNNSLDEKMDAIADIEGFMDETRETISDLNFLKDFILFLRDMFDEDVDLYLGIEIYKPTMEDVIE